MATVTTMDGLQAEIDARRRKVLALVKPRPEAVSEGAETRLRLWMADCAAHVLHIYESQHPDDPRPREAIIAARRFARGEIGDAAIAAALLAADRAAGRVSGGTPPETIRAFYAAWTAAGAAEGTDEWAVMQRGADAAIHAAKAKKTEVWDASSAEIAAAGEAAWRAERDWQLERKAAWLSGAANDWPLPVPLN